MGDARVLDATCGPRSMHFDKAHPGVIYSDARVVDLVKSQNQRVLVAPDVVADFTDLPFPDESFDLVVFDPPHASVLETSDIGMQYGTLWGVDWRVLIPGGLRECWRVLAPGGTLVFKWGESKVAIRDVLDLVPEIPPLIGHKTSKTAVWVLFHKFRGEGG